MKKIYSNIANLLAQKKMNQLVMTAFFSPQLSFSTADNIPNLLT